MDNKSISYESNKERLQKDYNLAVVFFNDKDYESFFVHIRPSIELICKFIILDAVGDNEKGHDVLEGNQVIIGGKGVEYKIKIDNNSVGLQGVLWL